MTTFDNTPSTSLLLEQDLNDVADTLQYPNTAAEFINNVTERTSDAVDLIIDPLKIFYPLKLSSLSSISTHPVHPTKCSYEQNYLLLKSIDEMIAPFVFPTKSKKKHNVSFADVKIREYCIVIGDSPSCSSGVPISLGWAHTEETLIHIDKYEEDRIPHRRSGEEMKMSSYQRKNLLRQIADVTEAKIMKAEKRIRTLKYD